MISELLKKQFIFASLVPLLINEAIRLGYTCTLGEMWRPPEMAAIYAKKGSGIKNSLHELKLAIDLNLFRDGKYLGDTEAHRILGIFWESLSVGQNYVTTWGGHWGDGNHYSVMHGGRK